jgi:hypothetical protein
MSTVLLKSGKIVRAYVEIATGAALIGDPTAFVKLKNKIVWVVPGESVEFVEA